MADSKSMAAAPAAVRLISPVVASMLNRASPLPLTGAPTRAKDGTSPSASVASASAPAMTPAVAFSARLTLALSTVRTGLSLIGLTVTLTTLVVVPLLPSLMVTMKVSLPLKSASG